jgi:hypothetical protein
VNNEFERLWKESHGLFQGSSPASLEEIRRNSKTSVRMAIFRPIYKRGSLGILNITVAHLTATFSVVAAISIIKDPPDICWQLVNSVVFPDH